MESGLTSQLKKSQNEVDRLLKNWRALLDAMPEMVLLINRNFTVEYLNPSAVRLFGNIVGQTCHKGLYYSETPCDCAICPVLMGTSENSFHEKKINEVHVEFSFVPFHGYNSESLVMVIMRDVTSRKEKEAEIAQFHENIESILQNKILKLNESEQIRTQLSQEINLLTERLERMMVADEMVGTSKQMRELRETIYQVADSSATILISGESGTGKELAANLLRNCSNRRDKPFLKVNCSSISDDLLESDLFGYEKGAFTGASAKKQGKFEVVSGGTIFLDEIGGISPRMQAALLRVLQNGEIIRVGGTKSIKVDVRIIAATNVDLSRAVKDGKFRLDLFYRLNIININIPPLRDRKDDIVDMAAHFVQHYRTAFRKKIDFMPSTVIDTLLRHDWPGNVRELENVIQRAVLMAKGSVITKKDLVFDNGTISSTPMGKLSQFLQELDGKPLKEIRTELERLIILHQLEKHKGKVQDVAKDLRVGKTVLYEKIKRYGITETTMN